MNCKYRTKDYVEYLTGELEPSLRASIEEHLPHCPRCRAEIEAYSRVLQGLQDLPEREPPLDLTESILRTLFPRPVPDRRRAEIFQKVATVLAAQALLISFLFAIRGLGGRVAVSAWNTLSEGMSAAVEIGRDGLALITSLSRVLEAVGGLFGTVASALNSALLQEATVASHAALLLLVFMFLTAVILWRLVGHPIPRPEREVRHARS